METQFDKRVRKVVDPELHKVIALFQSSEHPGDGSVDPDLITTVRQNLQLSADIKTELEPLARRKKKEEEEEDEESDPWGEDDKKESLIEEIRESIEEKIKELLDWTQFGDRDGDDLPNWIDVDDNIEDLLKALRWTKSHLDKLINIGAKAGREIEYARRDARNRVLLERLTERIQLDDARNGHRIRHLYDDMLDKFGTQQSLLSEGFHDLDTSMINLSDQLSQCCENDQLLFEHTNGLIDDVKTTLQNCCSEMKDTVEDIDTKVSGLGGVTGATNMLSGKLGVLNTKLDKLRGYL